MSLDSLAKPANVGAAWIGAVVAPWFDSLSTSGKFWAWILLFAIVMSDWISGTASAKRNESYRSDYGNAAVLRTVLLLFIPFIGWLLDKVSMTVFEINQPGVAYYALTGALIYHNWVSMTANCARAGWERWIPNKVLNYVGSEIKAKAERALKMKNLL
nr:phage holin family protein [Cohnella lubricantis]